MNINNPYNYPIPEFKKGDIIKFKCYYLIIGIKYEYNNGDNTNEFVYRCRHLGTGGMVDYWLFGEQYILTDGKLVKGKR